MQRLKNFSALICLCVSSTSFADAESNQPKVSPVPADASTQNAMTPVVMPPARVNDQEQAEGFVEGSHANLTFRNFYAGQKTSRDSYFTIPKTGGSERTDQRTIWIQAAMLDYRSGFTQGVLGLGLDLSVWGATNLERGKGAVAGGADRTLVENNGDPVNEWSRLAVGALKIRVSNTELRAGRLTAENPMLRAKDNRSLPSTFEGVSVVSNDFGGAAVQAGYIDRVIPRTGSDTEKFVSTFGNRNFNGDSLSYVGFNTKPWYGLSTSVYASRFENVWDRYYLGLTHRAGDSKLLNFKNMLSIYRTQDQGKRELGYIDNTIASLSTTLTHSAHSLTLAYQQVFGNEYFDYPWETSSNFSSISLYSDYNGPNERSAMAKYDLDFAPYGVPGLTTSLWYARGWGIDGTHYDGDRNGAHTGYNVKGLDGASHWETGLMASYVVQSGRLRNSSLRTIIFHHRGDPGQIDGNYDELRIIATAPFQLF